jgi:hypothetical protein
VAGKSCDEQKCCLQLRYFADVLMSQSSDGRFGVNKSNMKISTLSLTVLFDLGC